MGNPILPILSCLVLSFLFCDSRGLDNVIFKFNLGSNIALSSTFLSQFFICANAKVKRDAKGLLVCVLGGGCGWWWRGVWAGSGAEGAQYQLTYPESGNFPQWVRVELRTGITDVFMH